MPPFLLTHYNTCLCRDWTHQFIGDPVCVSHFISATIWSWLWVSVWFYTLQVRSDICVKGSVCRTDLFNSLLCSCVFITSVCLYYIIKTGRPVNFCLAELKKHDRRKLQNSAVWRYFTLVLSTFLNTTCWLCKFDYSLIHYLGLHWTNNLKIYNYVI